MAEIKLIDYAAQLLNTQDRRAAIDEIERTAALIRRALLPKVFIYHVLLILFIGATLSSGMGFVLNGLKGNMWSIWAWAFYTSAASLTLLLWMGHAMQYGKALKWFGGFQDIEISPVIVDLFSKLADHTLAATYGSSGPSVPARIFNSGWAFLLLSQNPVLRKWVRPWWGLGDAREIVITNAPAPPTLAIQPVIVNYAIDQRIQTTIADHRQLAVVIQQPPADNVSRDTETTPARESQGIRRNPSTRKLTDDFWMVGLPYVKLGLAIDAWIKEKAMETKEGSMFKEIYMGACRRVNGQNRPAYLKQLTGEVFGHITELRKSGELLGQIPAEATIGSMLSSSDKHTYADFKAFIASKGVTRNTPDV